MEFIFFSVPLQSSLSYLCLTSLFFLVSLSVSLSFSLSLSSFLNFSQNSLLKYYNIVYLAWSLLKNSLVVKRSTFLPTDSSYDSTATNCPTCGTKTGSWRIGIGKIKVANSRYFSLFESQGLLSPVHLCSFKT